MKYIFYTMITIIMSILPVSSSSIETVTSDFDLGSEGWLGISALWDAETKSLELEPNSEIENNTNSQFLGNLFSYDKLSFKTNIFSIMEATLVAEIVGNDGESSLYSFSENDTTSIWQELNAPLKKTSWSNPENFENILSDVGSIKFSFNTEEETLEKFNIDDISLTKITPTPEPSTILFMLTGILGIFFYKRKYKY